MFYLDLFGGLAAARVRYVVVGGLALNLHGVERATMDIDVAIALDDDNLRRAADALRSLGLVPIAPVSWDEIVTPGQLERWYREKHMLALGLRKSGGIGPSVDVLTRTSVPFESLYRNSEAKVLAGVRVPIASIDDLIAMKTGTGRELDASDVKALESLRRIRGGRS